ALLTLAEIGFSGDDLATDVLQTTRCLLADPRETLLGCHQLALQSTLLLVTPVTKPDQRDQQAQAYRPQRAVALAARRGFTHRTHHRWLRRAGALRHPVIVGRPYPRQFPVDIIIAHTFPPVSQNVVDRAGS